MIVSVLLVMVASSDADEGGEEEEEGRDGGEECCTGNGLSLYEDPTLLLDSILDTGTSASTAAVDLSNDATLALGSFMTEHCARRQRRDIGRPAQADLSACV